jgi:glutathione synthase/RimK-type ligase-like ATP-grasp enzyme
MKKVLILYGRSNWRKSKPFENKRYQYSYEYFYKLCQKNGIQMYRASYQWYDYEKNFFKHAWVFKFDGGQWEKVHNLRPDLIYDKTKARPEIYYKKELIKKTYPFINDLQFTQIIDDKLLTSLLFQTWSKKNYLIDSNVALKQALGKIKTNKFVLKPLTESGGKDVYILNKKTDLKHISFKKRYILQEFIDSSLGVPGISSGLHDLRLVFVNNKLIYSYIRKPQKGSFLANLSQGGSLVIIPSKKLPQSLFPIVKYVQQTFATFNPKIYSIDFMFDKKKRPWIVELNSMPGLFFTPAEKKFMFAMYKELLRIFKKSLFW